MFGSRSFTSQVLSNTLPADKARPMGHMDPDHEVLSNLFEDGFAVLLPLLDLLNYRPLSKVEWQAGLNEVGLQVLESFDGGQDVCNNYGPRDNEACTVFISFSQTLLINFLSPTVMLGYGFSIPDNPFDHYSVGFKVPPGSPLEEARAWRAAHSSKANKKSKADDSYRYYIFNAEHPRSKAAQFLETSIFSQDLFDSISVLSANIRELQSDRFRSTGRVLETDSKGSIDRKQHRNLFQTLCQLRLECSNRLNLLTAKGLRLKNGPSFTISQKQQYAKLYRDSQLLILETAALLCRYCLSKAQHPREEDALLIFSAAAAERLPHPSGAAFNVQILVQRTPSAIKVRTLFNFSDAAELLPPKLASKVLDAAKTFTRALNSDNSQQVTICKELPEKIRFTVLLAALRRVYSERSVRLSTQLKVWMKDLEMGYSFSEPFWNGPTEDFLPVLEILMEAADTLAPGKNAPIMDDAWCDPQMLCWGWNVQEEEGVFCDTEASECSDGSAGYQRSTYLLCIPGGHETTEHRVDI